MSLRVSAPGKAILMGEHAAVYGRPALVAAVDRRLIATFTRRPDTAVRLVLADLGIDRLFEPASLEAVGRQAREAWDAYARRPGPETFGVLRGDEPGRQAQIALAETAHRLGLATGESWPGFEVVVESDLPVGAGFGSSAALAVALAVGLAALVGHTIEPDALQALTLEIERRQHGMPSGVDNGAVIHGGVVWAERDAGGALRLDPVELDSPLLGMIRLFNSGEPAEPTGTVVAAVRALRDRDTTAFDERLEAMEGATRELHHLLAGAVDRAPHRLVELMSSFEQHLEALGVVPAAVRRRIRRLEERGAGVKISGAGSLTGGGAGSLLVYHRHPEELDDLLVDFESLDTRLGAPGVRIEA